MPPTLSGTVVPHPATTLRCLRIARVCGALVCAISLGTLVGWLADVRSLITVLPGFGSMKPNTAIILCLCGSSLLLRSWAATGAGGRWRWLSGALAGLGVSIGLLTLAEHAGGWNFGIDELLFHDFTRSSSAPGRMSPLTAINSACVGLALILLYFPKAANWAHALTACAAFTSSLAIMGYLYGVASLYQPGRFTAAALHTAIALFLLCAGVWCSASEHGFMRVVTDAGPSGKLTRRLGLASILLPVVIGWLHVQGVLHGWFSHEVAVVIVALAEMVIFTALVWIGVSSLRRAERKQAEMRAGLHQSEERLQRVVDQLTEGLIIADAQGQMLSWNRAALEMHGIPAEEDALRLWPEFAQIFELSDLDGRVRPLNQWPLARIAQGEKLHDMEVRVRRLDREWTRILSYSGSTVPGKDGKPLAFVTITDVTRQKDAEAEAEAAFRLIHQAHMELEARVLQRTSELAQANARLQEQIQERAKAEHASQQIMDHSLDAICTFDAEGRFIQVSRACETLWGYRAEELVGRRFLDIVHPDDQEKTIAVAASIMGGKAEKEFENRYLRPDGTAVPVVWTAQWSHEQQIMFCVARDMSARKQMEDELRHAKDAAEAASRSKSEFLANMSHEIRTPMNGIIGMTELVLDTKLDREQREYLGMAKSSAITLLGLINDILDFSKIEAGKLELEAIDFNLRDLIDAALKPLGIRADQKGLELTADIAASVPYHVTGDALRLRQVLTNLTDNAIKFTHRGDVTLCVVAEPATDEEHRLRFTVRDTGIGIPAEKQALIFDAFAQADGTTTRTYGGTGLGLAIASRLVRQMGGEIWVESAPGEGTAFHFTVRLATGKTTEAKARPFHPRRLEGLSVLVVDDNAINRRILSEMLKNWRMKPSVADSGEAGIAEMQRAAQAGAPYPLVILDGMMPGMDGFMAAEKIRENAEISGATVMMLSSSMPAGTAARCAELGVASYLTKPVCQADLIEAILIAIGVEEVVEPPAGDATPPAETAGGGLRILLAEDNLINRTLATNLLEKRGHSIVHAANGREAVAAALAEAFDLICMDVQMPEMDGLEATRRIREAEQSTGRHTPIVAMTAHAMSGDRERFLASGMDEYISKPLSRSELFALIERLTSDGAPAAPAPAAEAAAGPAASYRRDELLYQLDGDESVMRRIVALFHENTPHLLEEVSAAIASQSSVEVGRTTHALLSSLGAVGAHRARQLTSEIAAQAEEGHYARAAELFTALAAEVTRVDAALAQF